MEKNAGNTRLFAKVYKNLIIFLSRNGTFDTMEKNKFITYGG